MALLTRFRDWLLSPVLERLDKLGTLMSDTSNQIDALATKVTDLTTALAKDLEDIKALLSGGDPDVPAALAKLDNAVSGLATFEAAFDAETP